MTIPGRTNPLMLLDLLTTILDLLLDIHRRYRLEWPRLEMNAIV